MFLVSEFRCNLVMFMIGADDKQDLRVFIYIDINFG